MKLRSLGLLVPASRTVEMRHGSGKTPVFTQIALNFRSAPSHQSQEPYDACIPVCEDRNSIALGRVDRILADSEEPALGAHLVTPRLAFAHHGIYVGGGKVVHYGAFARQLRNAPVEEVSLAFFAHGHAVFIRAHAAPRFEYSEVIRRARSRLGEDSYCLLRNNCEHFCEWCVQGVSRSYQVERLLTFQLPRPTRLLSAAIGMSHQVGVGVGVTM